MGNGSNMTAPSGFLSRAIKAWSCTRLDMRGPVLDIVTGPVLPAVPDPRLAALPLSHFFLNLGGGSSIVGRFDSIRSAQVPEPGSLALLGLGLLGLGAARLRGRLRPAS